MAFWDFVNKLLGKPAPPVAAPTPAAPTPAPAPAPAARTTPAPAPPAPPVTAAPGPAAAPPASASPGDFLPIARDDLLEQGEDVRRTTGWMWFGRRDIIPPTSDPRTLLIDRGMLTQGFLTAEQLAEM